MADEQSGAEAENLTVPEEGAYGLSEAAVMMDQARDDQGMLATALEKNMEVWIAIRMMVSQNDVKLTQEVMDNLVRLSQYVAETTMKHGVELPAEVLDTLININLQISEGFLEGQ